MPVTQTSLTSAASGAAASRNFKAAFSEISGANLSGSLEPRCHVAGTFGAAVWGTSDTSEAVLGLSSQEPLWGFSRFWSIRDRKLYGCFHWEFWSSPDRILTQGGWEREFSFLWCICDTDLWEETSGVAVQGTWDWLDWKLWVTPFLKIWLDGIIYIPRWVVLQNAKPPTSSQGARRNRGPPARKTLRLEGLT